ncbi:MAG: hypothetical protein ACYDAR_02490 [Thermomicrobiales bacterium]
MGPHSRRFAPSERHTAHAAQKGAARRSPCSPTDDQLRAVRDGTPPAAEFVNQHGNAGRFGFFLHVETYLFCLAAMPDAPVMRLHAYR